MAWYKVPGVRTYLTGFTARVITAYSMLLYRLQKNSIGIRFR